MKSKEIIFCSAGIFLLFIYVYQLRTNKIKNSPPEVEILTPANAATFSWDSFIRYSIRVTDAEDGSSEYEEIPSKEVFLEVICIPGSSKVNENNSVKPSVISDPPGFALIKTSTASIAIW